MIRDSKTQICRSDLSANYKHFGHALSKKVAFYVIQYKLQNARDHFGKHYMLNEFLYSTVCLCALNRSRRKSVKMYL
jgi:hypothetical protein